MTVIRAVEQTPDTFIAYNNIMIDSNAVAFSATNTTAGFPATNILNYFSFDGFKPDDTLTSCEIETTLQWNRDIDYIAIYNTTLNETNSTIELQHRTGGIWYTLVAPFSVNDDNAPTIKTFTKTSVVNFRILIDGYAVGDPPIISVISVGAILPLENGLATSFASPYNAQRYESITNESESGNFIGRSVRKKAAPFTIETQLLQYDWMVDNWRDFVKHAERRPFFFQWSHTDYPDESIFCWTENNISTPTFDDSHFMTMSIQAKGLVE